MSSKLSTTATTIENLPCELMVIIFKLLNYEFVDLINLLKLRLVCKNWSTIIKNEIKFEELNIFDIDSFSRTHHYSWFYRNVPFNHKYSLYDYRPSTAVRNAKIQEPILTRVYLKSNLFKSLFFNLKYLNLNIVLVDKFNLEFLNEFKCLIHLQIFGLRLSKKLSLNLPNLNTFALYVFVTNKDNPFTIDAPKLVNLLYNGPCFDRIIFTETKSIKYLQVGSKWINKSGYFTNLEKLYSDIDNDINLEFLPNLKQLNLFSHVDLTDEYDHFVSKCIKILNKKKELNRSELEITLQSIKLTTKEHFNSIDFEEEAPFLQLNNYESTLVEFPCLYHLQFDNRFHDSIKIINDKLKIPALNDIFISKLNNLQSIIFYDLKSHIQNDLLNLLSKLNNLRELEFTDTYLEKIFFDQLPDFCPYLNHLDILANRINNDYKLMVKKFNYLNYLSLYTDYIKPRTIANCFKVKKHLLEVKFSRGSDCHNVRRVNNYFYFNDKKIDTFEQLKTKLFSI